MLQTTFRVQTRYKSCSKVKVMLIVFFDIHGLVHHEFIPTGQTVNKEYYLDVLKRLREKTRQKNVRNVEE